jgi:ABC-type transport system substrate-binding protein
MKKKLLALLLIGVMLVSLISGCSNSNTSENSTNSEERTDVRIYCEGVWTSLDPHGVGCTAYPNMYLENQMYEPLVYVNDNGETEPMLATEWTVSDDGLVYTFTLRDGVKFHNGETMTSADVVYSFERCMSEAPLETYYAPIDHVEADGDNKVVITLKYAFAPFVSYLLNIPIVNKNFASENSLLTDECGTGPYVLESIDLNTECKMTAFPDYWRGEASIKTAIFKAITEATTATVSFESGNLDFMMCYNVSSYAPLEETGKYNTYLAPTFHTAFIALNNTVEPLNNKLVRQALSYATDRETMIAIAYEGLAQPTYLMANTSAFGVSKDQFYNHYEYDLEKAKELLAQAGYADGLDLGNITVISGSYHEKYAQVWQQSLSQIGVKVELLGSESAISDYSNLAYTTCTMGEGFTNDFAYCASLYTGNNGMGYHNDTVTELFDLAAKEMDSDKRAEYYSQIIDIIYDECPNIPLFNKEVPWVWNKNLNAQPHFDSGHPYYVYEMSWN